jgi:hypothetical protein
MSTAILPSLAGLAFPITRTQQFDSTIQQNISGLEVRIANQTYPRWQWDATFNVLRSAAALAEFQNLVGFIGQRLGSYDSFLYQDPNDNSVIGSALGTGTGLSAWFQLVRSLGGFVEPILAPNAVSAVYLAGVSIPTAGYPAPGAPTLGSSSAGALGATTYFVKTTWKTNSGETLPGTEANLAVAANKVLTVTQPSSPPAGAVSWGIYASNTVGGGSGAETLQATVPIATTVWTEPTSGLVSGTSPPATNTTNWAFTPWGTSVAPGPGYITFGANVANGIAVTADFTYYWPCRFTEDKAAFELFLSQTYRVKKLSWISVKN